MKGDVNKAITIFFNSSMLIACQPAAMSTAPINPPTSACEELLGNPRYQVSRFHTIALPRAATSTCRLIAPESTMPPDRFRNCHAENERTDEICHRGHPQGHPRRERPGGDHGGHHVARIVDAVQKIENERQADDREGEHGY